MKKTMNYMKVAVDGGSANYKLKSRPGLENMGNLNQIKPN
jgi:hypothetical protein